VTLLDRLFPRTWLRKSQRLRFVTVNGVRCKRVMAPDAFVASQIEHNLEAFGPTLRFPKLVTRFENEVWVRFVPGERLARIDDELLRNVGAFYAEVYTRASRMLPTRETPWAQRLQRDLEFLHETGSIQTDTWRDLTAAAERIMPAQLLVGFDYTDPVLKNFVHPGNGDPLCAIDVESLVQGRPLGAGIAKASVFWLAPERREQLLAPIEAELPALRAQLPFVELCFLARWTKTKLLTGKRKRVREALFAPFRQG
jgi:hypothetical protein